VLPRTSYTLLLVAAPNAINATLYDKLNFNFIRDIAPVAGIMRVPNVIDPADFGVLIAEETDKWAKVIRAANIKAE
jgi:hypothetical protein